MRVTPNCSSRDSSNLLSNALKYSRKHEVNRIKDGLEKINNETVYFVKDNGAGFDMAYANKLFGAFQRLHTTNEFNGTGICLATVQRIIHRHGGLVWAKAKMEQGATFYFKLGNDSNARVCDDALL